MICSAQQLIPSGSKVQAFGYCRCYPWKESSRVSRAGKRWAALLRARLLSTTAWVPLPGPSVVPANGEGDTWDMERWQCVFMFQHFGVLSGYPVTAAGRLPIISGQAAEGAGKTR